MTTYKYHDERRNDPEIRRQVRATLDAKSDAFVEAKKLIEAAEQILHNVPYRGVDDAIYDRTRKAVSTARSQMDGDERYIVGFGSEIYVGNLAASALGDAIETFNKAIGLDKV